MNYLAHLFLSFDDPQLMLGNFIADEIALSSIPFLPVRVKKGVMLHRQIDAFTDDQESFKKAVEGLRKYHGKYASVVVDIINDHLLAKNWSDHDHRSLVTFESEVYSNFEPLVESLRGKAKKHVKSLLDYQYLKAYKSRKGLTGVMLRMDKRTRFPSNFVGSVDHLYDDFEFYDEQFSILIASLKKELNDMLERVEINGE